MWLFDLERGRGEPLDLNVDGDTFRPLVFSPDGQNLAIAYTVSTNPNAGVGIAVLSVDAADLRWSIPPSADHLGAAASGIGWQHDGHGLGVASQASGIVVYDGATGDVAEGDADFTGAASLVTALVYGPESVAVGTITGTVAVLDLATAASRGDFEAPSSFGTIISIVYDEPSGSLVASNAQGQLVGWEVGSDLPLFGPTTVQENQTATLLALGFTPGADAFLVGDVGGGVSRIAWGVDAWRASLCATAARNFTMDEWTRFFPGRPYHTDLPCLPRRHLIDLGDILGRCESRRSVV